MNISTIYELKIILLFLKFSQRVKHICQSSSIRKFFGHRGSHQSLLQNS